MFRAHLALRSAARRPLPAAPAKHQPSTSQAPAQPKAPTATDVVAAIQKGQSATTSLSHADGTSPDAQLTPQALAEMSEEQFEALYNEIMEKGDRKKLMDLFGH
jgi:hypothetical protein